MEIILHKYMLYLQGIAETHRGGCDMRILQRHLK